MRRQTFPLHELVTSVAKVKRLNLSAVRMVIGYCKFINHDTLSVQHIYPTRKIKQYIHSFWNTQDLQFWISDFDGGKQFGIVPKSPA